MVLTHRNYQTNARKFLKVLHDFDILRLGSFFCELIRRIKLMLLFRGGKIGAHSPECFKMNRRGYRSKRSKMGNIDFEDGSLVPGSECLINIRVDTARRNISP